jgi:hypothetical protein
MHFRTGTDSRGQCGLDRSNAPAASLGPEGCLALPVLFGDGPGKVDHR